MPTHVTHGGQWVTPFPGQGQGQGQGHPPPFAQLPVVGVTADSTVWTADTTAVTADGKVLYIPASVAEAASALDTLDAVAVAGGAIISADVVEPINVPVTADTTLYTADNTIWPTADGGIVGATDGFDAIAVAGGAVIDADLAEAAEALDIADAISVVGADAIETANALDVADAVTDVAADAIEAATAVDELDAAVGANVLFGTVVEAATALDQLHADVDAVAGGIDGGGAYYPPQQRPFPVVGRGYGILPRLIGEAHGVVGAVGKSAAQLVVSATAIGTCGQAGNATVVLNAMSVAAKGAVGARGAGSGVIVKFSGSATGQHDDDEAAVIAFLLAA